MTTEMATKVLWSHHGRVRSLGLLSGGGADPHICYEQLIAKVIGLEPTFNELLCYHSIIYAYDCDWLIRKVWIRGYSGIRSLDFF
jgi:hypothetical protein